MVWEAGRLASWRAWTQVWRAARTEAAVREEDVVQGCGGSGSRGHAAGRCEEPRSDRRWSGSPLLRGSCCDGGHRVPRNSLRVTGPSDGLPFGQGKGCTCP